MADYFNKVDFDKLFPPEVATIIEQLDKKAENNQALVDVAIDRIEAELISISLGTSSLIPRAVFYDREKSPFCKAMTTFQKAPSLSLGFKMVAMAKQDFGERFSKFVLEQLQTIYGSK